MNKKQIKAYKKLTSIQDKARYLLNIGVTATTDLVDLGFVSRATVGNVRLPITADTDEEAIIKGRLWLEEKASA